MSEIKRELRRVEKLEGKAAGIVWETLSKTYRAIFGTSESSYSKYIHVIEADVRGFVTRLQRRLKVEMTKEVTGLTEFQYERLGKNFDPKLWGAEIDFTVSEMSAKFDKFTQEEIDRILKNVDKIVSAETDWEIAERKVRARYRKIYNDIDKKELNKARQIVRTEVNKQNNRLKHQIGKREQAARKGWITTGGNVRETHAAAARRYTSRPIPFSKNFEVGADSMPYPCSGNLAEENVNCKCQMYLVFDE